MGESFPVQRYCEDSNGDFVEYADITATVEQIQVSDDLSLLKEEFIPGEWEKATGEDGKLVQNELSYIRKGDGVNTLDEIVATEMVNQKLVAADVTYSNTGDSDCSNILFNGSMLLLSHENGFYESPGYEGESGDGYDAVVGKSVADPGKMQYWERIDYGNGGNYIPLLAPGESTTIRIAWIVNEKDLGRMYLDLSSSGNGMVFTESTLQEGVIDIRQ